MNADSVHATIMIIDDEPENLNVLEEMLRQGSWDVRAFPGGEMALAAALEEQPDLVLLDIQMPGLDGYEVCRRFKADERLQSIPIIFLSAFSESADKVRAFEAGGVDYVTKPFAAIEVKARTHTHLQLRRQQVHLEELVRLRVNDLAEAHRRLRIWDGAKTQWLNTLSHEMNTPLTGVFGISELLFMELPPESDNHALRHDYDLSRRRIEKLVSDAMTLAQIDVAADSFATGPVPLMPVLRDALRAVADPLTAIKLCESLAALENVTVFVEPELLKRALTDLLLTASQCMRSHETMTLEATVTAKQAQVTIATSGESLPPEALETFFDVGGQRVLLKGGGDFGLGSALASRIVRLFNGRTSVRNGQDRGLLVEIALPLEKQAPDKDSTL